ncbi:type VII toxin-antitoxin system MntA family adenylyltransferase antitoxin [Effusibacillus dendaii]|uniref:Polymerase beta nucleotidyltransferase domain-containing protein n=1 Tax=Effusibacillus dendaii TaxID=2743772 RepID=A0A7I8DD03_9BACL|nr:nucleotidyltransferase domain-containing protein [Effusibacillus dendaii]BCJ87162.1 hypothetical protein skT53_21470 [Effusibacillus dendaii]
MAIEERIRRQIMEIMRKNPEVLRVTLFGSRARGDESARSDIDLAVKAPALSQRKWLELVMSLEQMDTLLPIDVVRWEEAPTDLKSKITQEGKVLYERS